MQVVEDNKMCGVLCEILYCANSLHNFDTELTDVMERIRRRGPDCMKIMEKYLDLYGMVDVCLYGSVLWMQGPKLTPQPIEDKFGVLVFNGDIFDSMTNSDASDTQMILEKLAGKVRDYREDHIIKVLRSLKGPFGLIYLDKSTYNLYFTRDRIGRSSLLIYRDVTNNIIISSVFGKKYQGCVDVPAEFIFCLNMKENLLNVYTWTGYLGPDIFPFDDWLNTLKLQQSLPDEQFCFDFDRNMDFTDNDNIINYIETTAKETSDKFTVMSKLMANTSIKEVVLKVTKLLEESVRRRVKNQPNKCKYCVKERDLPPCNHCSVGVLFSGGLDCTILALLADKFLPEDQQIDLINVAFSKDDNGTFDVPDRLTGRQSYEELTKVCPSRVWKFMEVNVTKVELEKFQSTTIANLVYPRKTILDESLGSALWFAARGKDKNNLTSSCRVLLLGSGADELFGGYTRHRNAYKRESWPGLVKQLTLDWKRISIRNLSRDNRVICDHGRQPRMPYLDEDFTKYVLQLKPWLKCFPSKELGPGIGDKLMLRLVAMNLGLSNVVFFPKRALQFGSRIANKKDKGSDISKSFTNINLDQ